MINKCFVLLEQKNWDLCEEEEHEDAEEEDGVMVVVVVEEQQHGVQLMKQFPLQLFQRFFPLPSPNTPVTCTIVYHKTVHI